MATMNPMGTKKYILGDDGQPVVCNDSGAFQHLLMNLERRIVAQDHVDGHRAVTLFMGLDQAPVAGQPPALWESEVVMRGEQLPSRRQHYRSRAAALAGHREIVAELRGA